MDNKMFITIVNNDLVNVLFETINVKIEEQ
jgi:hypothetical protein